MIVEFNKEVWIGVMMLRIGIIGYVIGYWFMVYYDSFFFYEGFFVFGNVNLECL